MAESLLLYGATGFTGKLILHSLLAAGVRPIVGGRNAARLRELAEPLDLPWRAAPLDAPGALAAALRDVRLVLNAAGPFRDTALPLAEAASREGVHYLDVGGEVDVLDALARRHDAWRRADVMVLPAVGFDVVPSDCLAADLARTLPGATHLRLGVRGLRLLSRGSAETLVHEWGRGTRLREDGEIRSVQPGTREHVFDYGDGPQPSCLVSWGDVATAYYSTGIPNVEVYFAASPALRAVNATNRLLGSLLATPAAHRLATAWHGLLPEGPDASARRGVETVIVAEVERPDGARRAARLRAGDSYEFTAASAAVVAARVLSGTAAPGFQTPARLFGPALLEEIGLTRRDA